LAQKKPFRGRKGFGVVGVVGSTGINVSCFAKITEAGAQGTSGEVGISVQGINGWSGLRFGVAFMWFCRLMLGAGKA